MNVQITQEDIDKGLKKNAGNCPLALAVRRKAQTNYVLVGGLVHVGGGLSYRISRRARLWINTFDQGRVVKPAAFRLVGLGK